MTPPGALIVFVRAPLVGAVKRRLAAEIGAVAARRAYADMTRAVLRRVGRDPLWRTWLFVTPDWLVRHGRFWPSTLPRRPQGRGGLGHRMAAALASFPGRPAVLIGSDIPNVSADHIAAAFAALGTHDYVFGPAADGGYWLVGARPGAPVAHLFDNVRWSTPHALADTLSNIPPHRTYGLTATLQDVDDAESLAAWRERTGVDWTGPLV